MTSRIRPSNRGACLLLVLAAVAGCVPAKRPQPAKAVADAKKEPAKEDKKELPKDELKKDDPAFPPLAAEAALEQAALLLGKGEPDLAKKVLEYLAARKGELNVPQLAEFERLTALAAKSSATSPKEVPAVPKEVPAPKEVPPPTELVEARKLAAAEKWDEALKSLEPFLAKAEEGEPKREATALRDKIQRQLADLRELREAVGQLGASGAEAEVARKRLWRDSERSLPLLLAGLSSDNPAQ
jgi:hypothetical protein